MSTPSHTQSPPMQSDPRHILIVEDDLFISELIKDALNSEGNYQASIAGDGIRALEMIAATPYDLIILDVSLPGLSGFEVYTRLQADPATEAIPVLFISAAINPNEFRKRNISNFLAKPFELDELFDTVHRLLMS